jgi:hypothetical protein
MSVSLLKKLERMGLILSKSIQSDMPVKGSLRDSISLYHSGKLDCSRFMHIDHEVMKGFSVTVFGNLLVNF